MRRERGEGEKEERERIERECSNRLKLLLLEPVQIMKGLNFIH